MGHAMCEGQPSAARPVSALLENTIMRHLSISAFISALALCATGVATAAGSAGAHAGGTPAVPAKSEATANSNGKLSTDRDKGLDRAADRRAAQSVEKTHGHQSHHHNRHHKHRKPTSMSSHT